MKLLRCASFFLLGVILVLSMENDFTHISQVRELFLVDVAFLLIWGAIFGGVLWAVWEGLSRAWARAESLLAGDGRRRG